jgi:hypothetical protein
VCGPAAPQLPSGSRSSGRQAPAESSASCSWQTIRAVCRLVGVETLNFLAWASDGRLIASSVMLANPVAPLRDAGTADALTLVRGGILPFVSSPGVSRLAHQRPGIPGYPATLVSAGVSP